MTTPNDSAAQRALPPEEAIDNAILAARLDPKDRLTHWLVRLEPREKENGNA